MADVTIRKCTLADLNAIRPLQPEGWNDITDYFRFYCQHKFCYPVVAESGRKIAGVAAGIENENTGWLAHIIVSQDHRRQGIGHQLTQHIVDYLNRKGCKTQLLIATAMGVELYQKLGFQTVSEYLFFKGEPLPGPYSDQNIRSLRQSDIEEILRLDREISGEDRKKMLEIFFSEGWVYSSNDREVRGYLLSGIGEGMIVAADEQAGISLLNLKLSQKSWKAVLPRENKKGIDLFAKHNITRYSKAPRMVLGKNVAWKPKSIYSRTGGFYG